MLDQPPRKAIAQKIIDNAEQGKIGSREAKRLIEGLSGRILSWGDSDAAAVIKSSTEDSTQQVNLTQSECTAIWESIRNRYKWYNRYYISSSRKHHVQFFAETGCHYRVSTADTRIPGIVRGPDQRHDTTTEEMHLPVSEDVYLIPVHQIVRHAPFVNSSRTCSECSQNLFPSVLPETPSEHRSIDDPFICPECDNESIGLSDNQYSTQIVHRHDSGRSSREYCKVDESGKIKFSDWLTGVSPGKTLQVPAEMPTEPTSLAGGFSVNWFSPADPLTAVPTGTEPELPALVSLDHDSLDTPVAIDPSDLRSLRATLH